MRMALLLAAVVGLAGCTSSDPTVDTPANDEVVEAVDDAGNVTRTYTVFADDDFAVDGGESVAWPVSLPNGGPVFLNIALGDGVWQDLVLHGPGECATINVATGLHVKIAGSHTTVAGSTTVGDVQCGNVDPGEHEVRLELLAGTATGHLVIEGWA